MGHGSWSDKSFESYAMNSSYATKSTKEIFKSSKLHQSLDPNGVKIRESRDSKDNPEATAVILGLDVTGSMGMLATVMAKEGLNALCKALYEKQPVSDPHIMCMGIGDLETDQAPLQASQFEADLRILEQLELLWLEGGGGGNHYESYTLPWYFAAEHTSIDCFEKRKKKGYIFTIGDENPTPVLEAHRLEKILGYKPEGNLTAKELLKKVSKTYEVFHLMVEEGSHYRRHGAQVKGAWQELLGQRAISLPDHRMMAETIVSIIQVHEGEDVATVAKAWDDKTAAIISTSIGSYNRKLDLDF